MYHKFHKFHKYHTVCILRRTTVKVKHETRIYSRNGLSDLLLVSDSHSLEVLDNPNLNFTRAIIDGRFLIIDTIYSAYMSRRGS